ncbi:MAG: hypothetical protein ACE5JK_06320 [Candidatus Omnitrophota bacterium]
MKKCETCLRKYDDTWGACLFCGEKLAKEEECKVPCEEEGTNPEEAATKLRVAPTILLLLLIIISALGVRWYFVHNDRLYQEMLERGYGGYYPDTREYTEEKGGD